MTTYSNTTAPKGPKSPRVGITLVQNRFLQSEIGGCPPIIVGEQFFCGSLGTRCPQEGNRMVQAASLFNQLLQHFPSLEFAALVKKHGAERAAKGFSCRAQLVAMLFCQLAHADSLREICNGLACCLGKLVHLGIGVAPKNLPWLTPTSIGPRTV